MVSRRTRTFAAFTLAVVAAAACSGLPGGPRATPDAPVKPLSHAQYQARLTAASAVLGDALDQVARAGSPDVLGAALTATALAGPRAANMLGEALAPPDVYESAGHLVQRMRLLGDGLQILAGQAESFSLCGGASAMSALSGLDHAKKLREAIQEVTGHGYQVRELIPTPTPPPDRHAANGTFLLDIPNRGLGQELAIDNGNDQDALVTLVRDGAPVLALYVGSRSNVSVKGIPNGTYSMDYTQGDDWDSGLKAFTRACAFLGIDQELQFDGRNGYKVSLKVTPAGNLTTHRVSPKDYPRV